MANRIRLVIETAEQDIDKLIEMAKKAAQAFENVDNVHLEHGRSSVDVTPSTQDNMSKFGGKTN